MMPREIFGLLLATAFGIALIGDVFITDYEIPGALITMMGTLIIAWFGLGLASRNGNPPAK